MVGKCKCEEKSKHSPMCPCACGPMIRTYLDDMVNDLGSSLCKDLLSNSSDVLRMEELSSIPVQFRESRFVKKAIEGSTEDQLSIGLDFLEGSRGFPHDPHLGAYWLTIAANGGNIEALSRLALCYLDGDGVQQDEKMGFRLMRAAADKGDEQAMVNVAVLAQGGRGIEVDNNLALEYIIRAANIGNSKAINQLGLYCIGGVGMKEDKKAAVQLFHQAAERGCVLSYANLAHCYEEGVGVKKDMTQAIHWLTLAADKGETLSQYKMGEKYLLGADGLPKDGLKARHYLSLSGLGGNTQAMYLMAKCCELGIDGRPDFAARKSWLEKAGEKGHADAIMELGLICMEGEHEPKDFEKAMQYFRESSLKGCHSAQKLLHSLEGGCRKKPSMLRRIFTKRAGFAQQ